MSFIEIEHNQHIGWFCNNDLILICDRETSINDSDCPFMDDNKLRLIQSSYINRTRRHRYIPKVNFNDEKLFPSILNKSLRSTILNLSSNEIDTNEELLSELNSMLACREYVSKQNHFFDRKQFQQAQAAQADEEKKLEEFKKRQQEQIRIERQQRRRQHPSYVSRFDEKRYVPSIRKKF
jgi:translation initiation factor 1 (eIF-1/SUI1)